MDETGSKTATEGAVLAEGVPRIVVENIPRIEGWVVGMAAGAVEAGEAKEAAGDPLSTLLEAMRRRQTFFPVELKAQ